MVSFFRSCPASLTFFAFQCPIFNEMSTNGSQEVKLLKSHQIQTTKIYQCFCYTSWFPLVTSINVGISPQNLLILSLNFFATLMLNFKAIPSASPNLLNLNQEHPSKNFSVKSLKTWVYDNFFHRNLELSILLKLQHIQFNFSHIIIFCLWRHGQKLWCHNLCFKMFF